MYICVCVLCQVLVNYCCCCCLFATLKIESEGKKGKPEKEAQEKKGVSNQRLLAAASERKRKKTVESSSSCSDFSSFFQLILRVLFECCVFRHNKIDLCIDVDVDSVGTEGKPAARDNLMHLVLKNVVESFLLPLAFVVK